MLKGPRFSGSYPDRALDCQHDLEAIFVELVDAQQTPFIDLASIAGPVLDAAEPAGWTIDDVAAALEELSINYQLRVAANRETDAAIATAMSKLTRH